MHQAPLRRCFGPPNWLPPLHTIPQSRWRRQLWGTGARGPSTSNCFIFLVTSEPHTLWYNRLCGCLPRKEIYSPIALSLFIAWISYVCVSSLNYFSLVSCPSLHQILATHKSLLEYEIKYNLYKNFTRNRKRKKLNFRYVRFLGFPLKSFKTSFLKAIFKPCYCFH